MISRVIRNALSPDDFKKILIETKVRLAEDITSSLEGGITLVTIVGHTYPIVGAPKKDITFFTPIAPHFHALDLIVRVGKVVIAFRIHTLVAHKGVLPLLESHVQKARWKSDWIHTIILVYLSPNVPATQVLINKLQP